MYEYDEWFTYADADGDGRVSGAEAVHFFMRAGLPKSDLAKLWDAADHEKAGYLDRPGFTLACALIGALQQYGTITRDVFEKAIAGRTRDFPKPKMQGLELPRPVREPAAPPAPAPVVEPERRREEPGGFDEGFFSQENASGQFSSPPRDDFFAMSSGGDDFSAAPAVAPAVAPTSQPVERTAFAAPPVSSASAGADASFDFSEPPQAASLYVQPTATPAPAPALAPPPMTAPEPKVEWPVIGPNDWQRYQHMFLANTNGNPDGRLTGPQTVPILLGLNAPKHVLKDVWELSDADKDGCLSWSEFVVAVYLTEQARNGAAPPRALPPGQFPPFSMTAGSQSPAPAAAPVPQISQAPVVAPTPTAPIDMSGLMTPSDVRQRALAASAPATAAPPDETYAYRGPEVNVNAMPEQDRDLTTKMRANAEKSDRELWEEELKERQNNLSAAAAKEVLANLGMFVRKCETNLTEASSRARAAEAQVNDYRKKCDVLRARVEELASELDEHAGRINERGVEYEELSARYAELEKRHEELTRSSGGNDSTSSRDLGAFRAKIEEKEAQIAAEESRARRAAASASAETAARPKPKPEAALMDFGLDPLINAPTSAPVASASAPTTTSSPDAAAKTAFDEWGNWGVSAREETPAAATTTRRRDAPSEIPAVAAALDTSDGGFFDAIDAPPPPSTTVTTPAPIPRARSPPADGDASFDDPFGAPPPTPPDVDASFDDPFGPAPSPGPTPPRRSVSLDVDPFAA